MFVLYLKKQLDYVKRVDIVWDTYMSDSLKSHAREDRGTGESLRVSEKTRLPHNWKSSLRVDRNKTELFKFLASAMEPDETAAGQILITTKGQDVASSALLDTSDLEPCSHEEADYRIMLHCFHAYKLGRENMIHGTETDVLVLAIVTALKMDDCEIWLAFGHGPHFRYIAAHTSVIEMGVNHCRGLLKVYHMCQQR